MKNSKSAIAIVRGSKQRLVETRWSSTVSNTNSRGISSDNQDNVRETTVKKMRGNIDEGGVLPKITHQRS